MPPSSLPEDRLRILSGEIEDSHLAPGYSRVLFPTARQADWLPFTRFTESVSTSQKKVGMHRHSGEEVVLYVIEGSLQHSDDAGRSTVLGTYSVLVLSAPQEIQHEISLRRGRSARWLAMTLPLAGPEGKPAISVLRPPVDAPAPTPEGALHRTFLGSRTLTLTASRLVGHDVEFVSPGAMFLPVGADRKGVAYVLRGTGTISQHPAEAGEGVLLDGVPGVEVEGGDGFRVVLVTALG